MTAASAAGDTYCRMESERPMSATISPPIVQPGFGFGNLTWVQWLATCGLTGRATMEDIRDVCAKSSVFIDRPRHRDGDRRGDGACRRRACGRAASAVGTAGGPASGATDFSSRARVYHHGGGGGAAAAAAFAGIVGTGLAIAAAQNRRAYYDDYDGYGGPVYYGGGPVYYGGPGYYGPATAPTAEVPSLAANPIPTSSARLSRSFARQPAGNHIPPTLEPPAAPSAWPADFFAKQRWPLTRWPSVWISLRK